MTTLSIVPRTLELLRFAKSHCSHVETLARATGERFNIFHVLGIGHLEVVTHSPVLAELLNPRGSHGQGTVFLRLFLDQFEIGGFHADTATVATEYHVGPVTEKSGGRLDIVVKDGKGGTILIENKIHAGDQENQMARYREFSRDAHLFYLTLDGHEPSNFIEAKDQGVRCVSYASDVLAWLRSCRKEAAGLPAVRETLTQYIYLIEELTNQSTTSRMNQELIDAIIQDEASLSAFVTLRNAETAVHAALLARLDTEVDTLPAVQGLERLGSIQDLGGKGGCFAFTTPGLREQNLQMCFEFDAGGYREFFFGFALLEAGRILPIHQRITTEFSARFQGYNNAHWPGWVWWHEYRDWYATGFEAIRSGQFAKDLNTKLEHLKMVASAALADKEINAAA